MIERREQEERADERADAQVEEQVLLGGPLPGWPSMKAPVTGSEKSVESARITTACAP